MQELPAISAIQKYLIIRGQKMGIKLFENLPITVVNHEKSRLNNAQITEIETIQGAGYLEFIMITKRWRPIIENKSYQEFCFTKMVALNIDENDYELCEALRDYHACAHIISRQYANPNSYILALPLTRIINQEDEYFDLLTKVAKRCRTDLEFDEHRNFLPFSNEIVSTNFRSKIDICQLIDGTSVPSLRSRTVGFS